MEKERWFAVIMACISRHTEDKQGGNNYQRTEDMGSLTVQLFSQ